MNKIELNSNDYKMIFLAMAEKLNINELISTEEKIKLINIIKKEK